MALGHKTGGRKAGTPNRKTREISEILEALGCDPIEGMAMIAQNEANPPELRVRMCAELAQHVHPKRKAVEQQISGPDGDKLEVRVLIVPSAPRRVTDDDVEVTGTVEPERRGFKG